jgi:hypothetical protein
MVDGVMSVVSIHSLYHPRTRKWEKEKEKRLYRRTQIPAAIRADGWNDFSANEQKKNLSMKTAKKKKKKKLGRRKRPWPFKGFPLQQSCSLVLFFSFSFLHRGEGKKERKKKDGQGVCFVCLKIF